MSRLALPQDTAWRVMARFNPFSMRPQDLPDTAVHRKSLLDAAGADSEVFRSNDRGKDSTALEGECHALRRRKADCGSNARNIGR